MRTRRLLTATAAAAISVSLAGTAAAQTADPVLEPVGTYDTLLGGNGAEILSVREKDAIVALTNVSGSIDIVDVSNPAAPTLVRRVDVSRFGAPNSVSVHHSKDYFVVAHGTAGQVGRVSLWRLSDGALLADAAAGIQPDSVKISPNGQWAVVANEAEGAGTGNNGGAGSITVVDLSSVPPPQGRSLVVHQVALPSAAGTPGFSAGRTDDAARLPITNEPETLEPESVAYSPNSRFAYITLQENSGVVRLDLLRRTTQYLGLGQTTHLADLTVGGGFVPTETLAAFREPDGIAVIDNGRYFVTADEGDSRDASGSSSVRGGRTVSVFDASTGAFVADTAGALDDAANSIGRYPDDRSNRGGSEPEVLAATTHRGRTLVAVGLERANAAVLLDLSAPNLPTILGIAPTGTGPEGVEFLHLRNELYVLTANEVAGTVSVLRVNL